MLSSAKAAMPIFVACLLCGCSPVGTAIKLGMHVVGKVVDDDETKTLGRRLIGNPPSAADQAIGLRLDVLRDLNTPRE